MSKICYLCGKGPASGNNVSHSKRRTKRRFMPNLVSMRFGGVKRKVCTACLRTLKKPERNKKAKEQVVTTQEPVVVAGTAPKSIVVETKKESSSKE